MALLLSAFGEFHRRGRPYAGLGVDSWNRTGAKRLYEKAGMTVDREYARYEKKLQGRKTSILDRCPPVASPRWPE